MKTPEETLKDIMERFDNRFQDMDVWVYANPTTDPKGISAKAMDGKQEILAFLKDSLIEFGESLIGEDELESPDPHLIESKHNNKLRVQQRQELEKISK